LTFPTRGLIDAFDRADEDPLSDGGKWSTGPTITAVPLRLVANICRGSVSNVPGNSYRNDRDYGPDVEVYVTWYEPVTLYARMVNPGASADGYAIRFFGTNVQVIRLHAGVYVAQLGDLVTQAQAVGDQVGMEIIGSTIKGYLKPVGSDWAEIVSRTDGTYSAAGKIGLKIDVDTWRADEFAGGTVITAPRFTVTSSSYSPTAGNLVTISAQYADNTGTPVALAGLIIMWSSTAGSVSPATSVTNSSGIATTSYTTATPVGSSTVTATCGTYIGTSPTITSLPGAATTATSRITSNPSRIIANGTDTTTVAVEAKDANNNFLTVGGATVTLNATDGTLTGVTDNNNGTYTATLTSNLTVETVTITGTLNGTAITDTEDVIFAPIPSTPNPDNFLRPRPVRSGLRIKR
jgi:hypothetical protein